MSDSYETIRNRIIERIPEDDDVREGSPIVIAIDPVAYELSENTLTYVDYVKEQCNPITADRENLLKHAESYNIKPNPATPTQGEGQFNIQIGIGARFSIDDVIFRVVKANEGKGDEYYYYTLECEKAGSVGNVSPGRLVPVQIIRGLTHAELIRITINGEDEEDTESLRSRVMAVFNQVSYGGNVSCYFDWITPIAGVGHIKVLSCENPEGEVKESYVTVMITDSDNKKPTEELISRVQEAVDPKEIEDLKSCGLGLAPIGADVYIVGVKEKEIAVSFRIQSNSSTYEMLESQIKKALETYIEEQNNEWGDYALSSKSYKPKTSGIVNIRKTGLEGAILSVEDVVDVFDLTINGAGENVTLNWDEIAKLGEISGQ